MNETVGFLRNPATKKYFLIGGGAIGAYFVYRYFKAKSSGTSSGAVTSDSTTATDDTIDPATGISYSEEASYAGITSSGAIGQNFDAATGTYGVDPNALRQELGDLGYSSNTGQTSTGDPNIDPSNFKSIFVDYNRGGIYGITNDDQEVNFTPTQWTDLAAQGAKPTYQVGTAPTPATK